LLPLDLISPMQPQSLFNTPYYPTSSFYDKNLTSSHQNQNHSLHQTITHHTVGPATHNASIGSPNIHGLPPPPSYEDENSNFQIYSQLQFPSTSNKGSMKKKKTDSVLDSSDPSPSPSSPTRSPTHREREYYEQGVKVWTVEYVPDVFTLTKKTVKV
jgi:hypothetical protein